MGLRLSTTGKVWALLLAVGLMVQSTPTRKGAAA